LEAFKFYGFNAVILVLRQCFLVLFNFAKVVRVDDVDRHDLLGLKFLEITFRNFLFGCFSLKVQFANT